MPKSERFAKTAFLPMIYVAWADGELSDDEIRLIRSHATHGADVGSGEFFDEWLNPERPPSAQQLGRLLIDIRKAGKDLSLSQKQSLVDLGLALARASGAPAGERERHALKEIEQVLFIDSHAASRFLLAPGKPITALPEVTEPVPPDFEIEAMARLLDGDHGAVRATVRSIISRSDFQTESDLPRQTYREKVLHWCQVLAEHRLGSLGVPHDFGGGSDAGGFIAAFETLAFGDLSLLVKFGVQFGLFAGTIFRLGTTKHHRAYLREAGTLELPGCFAMTETGHGSNVQDLETVAHYLPATDSFAIHTPYKSARKDYIGNAALHGRLAVVFAQLVIGEANHGVHAFLVPIRNREGEPLAGVRIEDCGAKMGLNGVDNGRLWFDQVHIPRENLLDRFAQVDAGGAYHSAITSPGKRFFTMLSTLVGGRVSVAMAANSAAKLALTIAIRYAAQRRQFGPAGGQETHLQDYPSHQRKLMPLLASVYVTDFALKHLAAIYVADDESRRREVESLAAGLKAFSTALATRTIQTCREACGGQGYLAVNRFAALKADTDVFSTFEGDNTVLLQLVAKSLLTGYRQQFSGLGLLGLARYLAGRAIAQVAALNPIAARMADEGHLRNAEFQIQAMRWREESLLTSAASRLKRRIEGGMEVSEAFNECQNHLLALARAHVERVIIEQCYAAETQCEDPALRHRLAELRDLYALWHLEQDLGWFLENGNIESPKARAIRRQVDKLCLAVSGQALPLVAAFSIPDACLEGTIATLIHTDL